MGAGNQSGGSNGGAGGSRELSCDANHRVLLLNPETLKGFSVFWFCLQGTWPLTGKFWI